jgi:hypothetical protein
MLGLDDLPGVVRRGCGRGRGSGLVSEYWHWRQWRVSEGQVCSGRGSAPSQISREVTNCSLSLHCRPRPWQTLLHRSRARAPHALRPYAVPCVSAAPRPRVRCCSACLGRTCRLCVWSSALAATAQVDAGEQALRATFCGALRGPQW